MDANTITLRELLSSSITDEIIILPKAQGEQLEQGGTVSGDIGYCVVERNGFNAVETRNGGQIALPYEIKLRRAKLEGPYEGVTTYIIEENIDNALIGRDPEEHEERGCFVEQSLLHRELWLHLASQHAFVDKEARMADMTRKLMDLRSSPTAKNFADLLASVAMYARAHYVDLDEAIDTRNEQLRRRLAETGSMLNPEKVPA